MGTIKAFIETTIFNRYFEEHREYNLETQRFFHSVATQIILPYTSVYVIDEIVNAPQLKKEKMLELIKKHDVVILNKSDDIIELADIYVKSGLIPPKFRFDAIHIASSTIHNMDCIISLNFQHINKIHVKNALGPINTILGYSTPTICTPGEVIYE
jgi:hypothetical protein